ARPPNESSEMPPLPVSKIKFNVSGISPSLAFTTITPPLYCLKGKLVTNFACGTGVTAVAISMAHQKGQTGHVETPVKVLGGDLNIKFDYDGQQFTNVFLCGPAEKVFEGEIAI
ncbi:MAG: hypothetical protein EOO20_22445, partial [Chryseobacterium sp.]